MLNIHELESRWIKYKIKSYMPYMIFFLFVILLGIFLFFYLTTKDGLVKTNVTVSPDTKKLKVVEDKKLSLQSAKPQEKVVIPENKKTPIQTSKVSLEPSLNFINKIQNDSPRYYNNNAVQKTKKVSAPVKQTTKKIVPTKAKKQVVKKENIQPKAITIDKQVTQNDINHVLKRFKKSNNPALSLFVAKKYYELQDYKQAYNYALITNGINSNIEESWIVFAKSIFHLGEKEKAIEVLKKYISKSGSGRAKTLLKNIHSGKVQ